MNHSDRRNEMLYFVTVIMRHWWCDEIRSVISGHYATSDPVNTGGFRIPMKLLITLGRTSALKERTHFFTLSPAEFWTVRLKIICHLWSWNRFIKVTLWGRGQILEQHAFFSWPASYGTAIIEVCESGRRDMIMFGVSVCVQVERQSHSLGSAVSVASRDHRQISQHDGRSRTPADGQRESRCQVHGLLLPLLKSETRLQTQKDSFVDIISVTHDSLSRACRRSWTLAWGRRWMGWGFLTSNTATPSATSSTWTPPSGLPTNRWTPSVLAWAEFRERSESDISWLLQIIA